MQEIFEKYYKIIQSNELFEGIDEKICLRFLRILRR